MHPLGVWLTLLMASTAIAQDDYLPGSYMQGEYDSTRANGIPGVCGCLRNKAISLEVEFLALANEPEDEFTFDTSVPNVSLSTGDFESEFDTGTRWRIAMGLTDSTDLEAVYLANFEWADVVQGSDAGTIAAIAFDADFNNAELNLVHHFGTANVFRSATSELAARCGLRYADINQRLTNVFDTITTNDLWGLQFGGTTRFSLSRWAWLQLDANAGVFSAEMKVSSTGGVINGVTVVGGTDRRTRTAWGGDFGIQYHYRFAPAWTVRLGYTGYWYTGIAVADRNLQRGLELGTVELDHAGTILYHGPNLGLIWSR